MTVEFDPRARGQNLPAASQTGEGAPAATARGQSLDTFDPLAPVQNTVSELDLLFSGSRSARRLRQENPLEGLDIPGLSEDILGRAPILGSSSRDMNEIIRRYGALRRNLTERRNNYAHALESTRLRPEEAMDLHDRLEQMDSALAEITRQLQSAELRKKNLETMEERQRLERIREEDEKDRELHDRYCRSLPPGTECDEY